MNKQLINRFSLLNVYIKIFIKIFNFCKIIFTYFNLLLISTVPTITLAYSTYTNTNDQINNRVNSFSSNNKIIYKNNSILEMQLQRVKRQYYEDGYYNSYYGWQAGRLIGWFLGFMVLIIIICVPCVCCVGIWFAGWFGVRQTMMSQRRNTHSPRTLHHYPTEYSAHSVSPIVATNTSPVITYPSANVVRHQKRSKTHFVKEQPPSPTIRTSLATQHSINDAMYTQSAAAATSEDRYYARRPDQSPPILPHVPKHRNHSTESREYYRETRRL